MALPLLAPLAWLLPIVKIMALGSVKFLAVGLGAAVAPVTTANMLVNMSSGTPLKYAKFRTDKGHFSQEQLTLIKQANQIIVSSIENENEQLTRREAREFLKEVLLTTFAGMKESLFSIPKTLGNFFSRLSGFITKR